MTTPHPQEIELKLTLPPGRVDAFRKRMARRRCEPVEQDLVTRYFDTPDFALSARGVALRVRRTLKGTRAGRRWLQTLKTEGERQGGLSRRVEFELPVKGGALDWTRFPPEALAYVPEALRDAVQPVFETRFHRTAWLLKGKGGAQIEVALDVGEVHAGQRSQPLCEVELELKAGQPDALFALALEWAGAFGCLPFDISKAERGVRLAHGVEVEPAKSAPVVLDGGMSVEDGFAVIVQACLAQFQANLPGVLGLCPLPLAGEHPDGHKGADVMPTPIDEYVHQARVALRRLRAALRLFRRVCGLPAELMDGLRALAGVLGPARDWDVLLGETLPGIAPHDDDAAAWRRGIEALEAKRVAVRVAMLSALAEAQPGAWLLAMQRWLLRRGWRQGPEAQRFAQLASLDEWARQALRKGHRPIKRGARAFGELQLAQRHALRIAIKRQRYAVEFFQGLFASRRQQPYLDCLRAAQDSLGRSNDAHVAWQLLTDAQVDAGPMLEFARGWLAAMQAIGPTEESVRHLQNFMKLRPYW